MYTLMNVFYCFVFTFLLNSLKLNLKQGGGLDIMIRALLLEMSNLRKLPNLQGSIDDAKVFKKRLPNAKSSAVSWWSWRCNIFIATEIGKYKGPIFNSAILGKSCFF